MKSSTLGNGSSFQALVVVSFNKREWPDCDLNGSQYHIACLRSKFTTHNCTRKLFVLITGGGAWVHEKANHYLDCCMKLEPAERSFQIGDSNSWWPKIGRTTRIQPN